MKNEVHKYIYDYGQNLKGEKSSVHYNDTTRLEKAKKQAELNKIAIEDIVAYTNEFLGMLGMNPVSNPKLVNPSVKNSVVNESIYASIQSDNNLFDIRDIVWMKFTKDGYLGVVAVSNDINFDIPELEEQYNYTDDGKLKSAQNKWKYNTSGIIVHHLKKEWDESFVLIFPLQNIPSGLSRGDIECGVGNYLIDRGVPILDYYSHRF